MATDDLLARAQDYWFRECKDGREVRDRRYLGAGDLAAFARVEIARELEAQAEALEVSARDWRDSMRDVVDTGTIHKTGVMDQIAMALLNRAAALRKGE